MVKCVVFYVDLSGEDSGCAFQIAEKNTIDEAEAYMRDCAETYLKYEELHYGHILHGIQGTSPIAIMREGEVDRIYYVNIVND